MGKEHDYCCCAIPLLNTGIYITLFEQLAAGVLIGTLTIAAPSVVGVSVPSFTGFIFAALCYAVAITQVVGFLGVSKENTRFFSLYTLINTILTVLAFALSAAIIGISASQHSTAVTTCEASFFPASGNSSATAGFAAGEALAVCNIITWVDVGVLGGLWVLLAIFQGYLLLITRFYSRDQRADHKRYYNLYDSHDDILLADRGPAGTVPLDPWDARPSSDLPAAGGYEYSHARQASDASTIRPDTEPERNAYPVGFQPFDSGGGGGGPVANVGSYGSPPGSAPSFYPNPYPQESEEQYANREPQPQMDGQRQSVEAERGIYGGDVPGQMGMYDARR